MNPPVQEPGLAPWEMNKYGASVRQGDWKLVRRTLLPSSLELYDLAQDPSEKNNVAAEHPDRVAELHKRIEELAKGSDKPLFLIDQFKVVMKNMAGEPVMPTDEGFGEADKE